MLAVAHEHTIPGWTELENELDAWSAVGKRATFWWRDDDATQAGPRLERLLAAAGAHPISLAVIAAEASPELAQRLHGLHTVTVLQHGYAHVNHAPANEKKAEFGDHRPLTVMGAELNAGRERLEALFGDQFFPVFVPPWNRFADALPTELATQGFTGLSAYGPRGRNAPHCTLNCHADIIDWRGDRGFLGEEAILKRLVDHLAMRRRNAVEFDEPTGLLTHHLVHDPACWRFMEVLAQTIENHPAAAWMPSISQFAGARR